MSQELHTTAIDARTTEMLKLAAANPAKVDVLIEFRVRINLVSEAKADLGGKYLKLCEYIRENYLTPEVVRRELDRAGYPKPTIAEICRVSFVSNEIFNDFKNRIIGFKVALKRSRADLTAEQKMRRQWNELVRKFENNFRRTKQPYYEGPSSVVCMWKHRDFKENKLEIDLTGYRVTVERKPKTEKKDK